MLSVFILNLYQVHIVLGIFQEHGHVPCGIKIDSNQLKVTYNKLHHSFKRITTDDYHCAKLDDMLEEWAALGM